MRKILAFLVGALLFAPAYADVWQAQYGVARSFDFRLYNTDGTLDVDEVDGGTEVTLDCDGTPATATNDFADEGSYYSISLTAAELQCERVTVTVAATDTNVFHIQTYGSASAFNETLGWLTGDSFARLGPPAGASIAADLVVIDNFVDGVETAQTTAQNDLDTITGAAGALIDQGTGTGQLSFASGVVASNPGTGLIANTDFATAPGAAGGLFIAGTNAATTITTGLTTTFTGNVTGSVGSVTGAVGSVTGAVGSVTGNVGGNVTGSVGSFGATALLQMGVIDEGTAAAYTHGTPSVTLDGTPAFADNDLQNAVIQICGSTEGYCLPAVIASNVASTEVATLQSPLATEMTGTITYRLWGTPGSLEMAQTLETALLNCEVNTANFAGDADQFACILTDKFGAAVTQASNDLEGLEVVVMSGAQIREKRFIENTVWDGANSELQIDLSRDLPGTLADAVSVIIR